MKNLILVFLLIGSISGLLNAQQTHGTGLIAEDISKNKFLRKAESSKVLFKLAQSVDNSEHLPSVGNQGLQNSCLAWAWGYYYKTYQEWQDYGWSVSDPIHIFSPSFIYNQINGGRDRGALMSDALKLLIDNGCTTINDFPYQSDLSTWPSEYAYLNAMKYRSLDAYYIQASDMAGIEQVKQHLANKNIAVLGISIYGNFDDIHSYNNTYCLKDTTGNNRGSHAITVVGYDDNKITRDGTGAFKFVNSWGTSWGDYGYGWMSYQAVMDTILSGRTFFYTTDRIHYKPTIIASVQLTHTDRNLLKLTLGIGMDNLTSYSKNYLNFDMNTMSGLPSVPFPDNKIDFDISDGLEFLDTTKSNNIFLKTSSTVQGKVDHFAVTDLRVSNTVISTETPMTIPGNNDSIFTNLTLNIVPNTSIFTKVAVRQGWNLISMPLKAADMSAIFLFPNASSPTYNYESKYGIAASLENGKGYWIKYAQSDSVEIYGTRVNKTEIPVTKGWNLVGGYEKNINTGQITTNPWGIINSQFYGYDNKYAVSPVMEPGKSYWIRVNEDGVLNIENAFAKERNLTISANETDPKWIKITVTDSRKNHALIYGALGEINFDNFSLPPLPPNGVFDVRWESSQSADNIGKGKDICLYSAEYPVNIKVEGGNLRISDKVGGKIINTIVTDGQNITITNPAIERLSIKASDIPASDFPNRYTLCQNYPNPFNPLTTISYSISQQSFVELKVYNMLGLVVSTLIHKTQSAGDYKVQFDGSSLPSGAYIYTLKAGSFRDSKKLLLLK